MMRTFCTALTLAAVAACSASSESSPPPCADITGNYNVSATVTGGTCDPSLFKGASSISFAKAADGTWSAILAAVPGGCQGTLNAATCRFTANCEAAGKDGTVVATFSYDLAFSATGFSGSEVGGLHPPAVQAACTATFQETGTKL